MYRTKPFPKIILIFLVALLRCSSLHAQGYYVFIGSYNWDKTKPGIYVYELDTANGKIKFISDVRDVLNPAYLTIAPDSVGLFTHVLKRKHLAVGLSAASFDPEKGRLSFLNEQKSGGENPVYLTVHKSGRWMANANYTGGSVSVYKLALDGKIETASQIIAFKDSSINKNRQDHSHIHSAIFSPVQDYIFLPDLGADKIRCFAFDQEKDQPLQTAAYPYTGTVPGSGPRHFVFHPNGRFCYCTEEMGGAITAYSYADGKLDSIQRITTHKKKIRSGYSNADIHISPDGRFLYASNRNENNIAIFSIGQDNGKLTAIGYESTRGDHPRNFVIDPTGKFLLVANQISGDIFVFRRDSKTGLLSKTGRKTKVRGASCLKIREY